MSASVQPSNDQAWADDFRKRFEAQFVPITDLLTEAKTRGFDVNMTCSVTHGTQVRLVGLRITKDF